MILSCFLRRILWVIYGHVFFDLQLLNVQKEGRPSSYLHIIEIRLSICFRGKRTNALMLYLRF